MEARRLAEFPSKQMQSTSNADPSKFWSARRILATITGVPWAYLVWSGYDLCYGPHVRVVPGYPNPGQVHLYVAVPLIGFLVSIAVFVLANKIPIWVGAIVFCLQVLVLLPVLGMWAGGV
jgi:hypothetical protein